MKKRILALSLAAAMVIGALASCTKTAEPASSEAVEARDITLTLWGSEGDNEFLKEISAEWAKTYADENDDVKSVTVDVQIKGEDAAGPDALNDIEAAADVFGIGNDQLSGLSASNAIYKMPAEVVDQIKAIVGESALASTLCDGTYYGFPYAPNTAEIMFYNKELVTDEEAADLNKLLEKEFEGGVTNLAVDIDNAWNAMTWFASAGAELFTGGDKTVNTLNKPEATEMLKWLKEQVDAKKIVDVPDNDSVAPMLGDKQVAAMFFGSWKKNDIADVLGDNYGVRELPALNGKHLTCFGGSKLLVLNATTKEPEAALALAQYIISEDAQLKRFKSKSQQTPTAVNLANNDEVKADPAVASEVAQGAYTVTNSPLNNDSKYWDLCAAVMGDIKNGKITADEIQGKLDEMVTSMNANLGL